MPNSALYVYGIVGSGPDQKWAETGLNGKKVYTISAEEFTALVHDCEEKPYISESPDKIRELIIAHNAVLDKAMEDFGGVIPLHFNTIIKKGENSPQGNLKKWMNEDKERLEKIWNKTKGRREYGIRIYYEKDKLIEEASDDLEVKAIEKSLQGKTKGLNYLLQGAVNSRINEIVQSKINRLKQQFYGSIGEIAEDVTINTSKISIDEKKDLLLSLSVLVGEEKIDKIKGIFEQKEAEGFSFHLAGPFAPYSFAEK